MKKFIAEQYFFSETKDHLWFIVTLCGETGTVDIQSDHGEYQHQWPSNAHQRKSLKHFLATGSPDYFMDKFGYPSTGRSGAGHVYDPNHQKECFVDKLKQKFEDEHHLTWEEFLTQSPAINAEEVPKKDEYLDCFEIINNHLDYSDPHALIEENENNSVVINFLYGGDWSEIISYTTDFHLKEFMKTCWPVFQSELVKELNNKEGAK